MRGAALLLLLLVSCAPRATVHVRAAEALGPYSGAVLAGDYCFVSGKIGQRGGPLADEAATAIDAVETELARAGLTLADVVQVTVYLTDIGDYAAFNAVYARRFPAPFPARACVAVKALPGNARLEIQVIARRR